MVSFKLLLLLAPLAAAHYHLRYPAPRTDDLEKMMEGPCGGADHKTAPARRLKRHEGHDDSSIVRTDWPLNGGQIELEMGHDRAMVQVVLALGNDPGPESFNTVLVPTAEEQGQGTFCMTDIRPPQALNISDGTNATIQVITNAHPNGGLYACADITFRTSPQQPSRCSNNTGVTALPATDMRRNANETQPGESGSSSASASGSGSATASESAAAATPTGAAAHIGMEWGVSGAILGALGFALLL